MLARWAFFSDSRQQFRNFQNFYGAGRGTKTQSLNFSSQRTFQALPVASGGLQLA